MKTLSRSLLLAALFCLSFSILNAQEKGKTKTTTQTTAKETTTDKNETSFHTIDYMKVKEGKSEDYIALEKAWKKIHEANVAAGKYEAWTLSQVISPSGADTEYNYITRQSFKNQEQYAALVEKGMMPENWKDLLTPDERKLVDMTTDIRSLVKTELWEATDRVLAENLENANITVFNFFDFPEGKTSADHYRVEKDYWMPVHKARVDDGSMKGWVLLRKVLPFGADEPYHDATVDIYESMTQYMTPMDDNYFTDVHPDKNPDDIMNETRASSILVRGEVRRTVDKVRKKPMSATTGK